MNLYDYIEGLALGLMFSAPSLLLLLANTVR